MAKAKTKPKKRPYLTKSKFVTAHKCERWLWKSFKTPPPYTEAAPGSPAYIGNLVGDLAHDLFPSGILVTEKPYEHQQAVERTQRLMADKNVPAIFEAAFEHDNTKIRVDVLERTGENTWGIREVKSSTRLRKKTKAAPLEEKFLQDIALQIHVLAGAGVEINSIEFIHVDKSYVRGSEGIDPKRLLRREDVSDECAKALPTIGEKIDRFMGVLRQEAEPPIEPTKSKCNFGFDMCPFWENCTRDKPADWLDGLYGAKAPQKSDLLSKGITRLSLIDPDTLTDSIQFRMVRSATSGLPLFEDSLSADIGSIELPAIHLDFEYFSGLTLPIFEGTSPAQKIPFQYSAHRLNADLSYDHIGEYLADGSQDPSREFAENLIELLADSEEPIVAYSAANAELPVLEALELRFPDIEDEIGSIRSRVVDLAKIVKDNVMVPEMIEKSVKDGGSLFSLKNVAPALVPGFTYDDLGVVSQGAAATEAFYQLASSQNAGNANRDEIRRSLLAYCKKDTEATLLIHVFLLRCNF